MLFQLTAARRRLDVTLFLANRTPTISTHSRAKAAGNKRVGTLVKIQFQLTAARRRLDQKLIYSKFSSVFQLTAARRRLANKRVGISAQIQFQLTAARRRLDESYEDALTSAVISTHSRAKAAGHFARCRQDCIRISTHSRAKAAGAAAETLNPQGLHRPVSLRFH